MKKILVTGGTVFVSRYIAEYYVAKGCDVYVLNRNSKKQSQGVTLIERYAINIEAENHKMDERRNGLLFLCCGSIILLDYLDFSEETRNGRF